MDLSGARYMPAHAKTGGRTGGVYQGSPQLISSTHWCQKLNPLCKHMPDGSVLVLAERGC